MKSESKHHTTHCLCTHTNTNFANTISTAHVQENTKGRVLTFEDFLLLSQHVGVHHVESGKVRHAALRLLSHLLSGDGGVADHHAPRPHGLGGGGCAANSYPRCLALLLHICLLFLHLRHGALLLALPSESRVSNWILTSCHLRRGSHLCLRTTALPTFTKKTETWWVFSQACSTSQKKKEKKQPNFPQQRQTESTQNNTQKPCQHSFLRLTPKFHHRHWPFLVPDGGGLGAGGRLVPAIPCHRLQVRPILHLYPPTAVQVDQGQL